MDDSATLGPVINQRQFDHVQQLIHVAVRESSTIAVEEVFGPVLAVIAYETVDEAIEIANSSEYGLAAYVHGVDHDRAVAVAEQLDVGQVQINRPEWDPDAPFGGRKQSGYGRDGGAWGVRRLCRTHRPHG